MASNINPNNVDGTYPIAGQDNDSQGFRDNFTNIKSNFTNAKSEIEDLQSKVLLKSPLTGTSLDNDGDGALMTDFEIRDFAETRVAKGANTGTVTFNHVEGHYQSVELAGNVTFDFTNFPSAGKLGRIRVEVFVPSTTYTLTFDNTKTYIGLENIIGMNADTGVITFSRTGTFVYELTSDDGGSTFAISELSQAGRVVEYRTISTSIGRDGDVTGAFAFDADYIYVCTADYDGSTNIWKRFALPTGTWS